MKRGFSDDENDDEVMMIQKWEDRGDSSSFEPFAGSK